VRAAEMLAHHHAHPRRRVDAAACDRSWSYRSWTGNGYSSNWHGSRWYSGNWYSGSWYEQSEYEQSENESQESQESEDSDESELSEESAQDRELLERAARFSEESRLESIQTFVHTPKQAMGAVGPLVKMVRFMEQPGVTAADSGAPVGRRCKGMAIGAYVRVSGGETDGVVAVVHAERFFENSWCYQLRALLDGRHCSVTELNTDFWYPDERLTMLALPAT
jgi:hypothetical protein